MAIILVVGLIVALFLVVGVMLGYGAYTFRNDASDRHTALSSRPSVNMRREVLWTGISAALLLGVFVIAH